MKNTNKIAKIIWQGWMYICTTSMTIIILMTCIAFLCLITQFDFGTNFFEVDTCLDMGGRWNETVNDCEGLGS